MNRTDRPARCAAVHDLSGLGRCSLSVILPAMSVMGVHGESLLGVNVFCSCF